MEILIKANTPRYLNANHVEFHKLALAICVKYASAINAQTLLDDYAAAVTKESEVFIRICRSEFTGKKAIVDRRRAEFCMRIADMVRVNLHHLDPDIKNAAVHVNNLLSGYGYLPKMNYDAKTAAVDSVVANLRGDAYRSAMQQLGLTPWVDGLDELNVEFKTCAKNTALEELNRPDVTTKQARIRSDRALWRIMSRVESLADLNGRTVLDGFIEEYNTLARHYLTSIHEHLGRLNSRIDISNAEIAFIAPQPFTGEPVTVIPEVSLHSVAPDNTVKVTKLVFTSDFTVTYGNNINPGTATLHIRGTGKYRGKIVTTFNIVISG